jgi:hypothetical protein
MLLRAIDTLRHLLLLSQICQISFQIRFSLLQAIQRGSNSKLEIPHWSLIVEQPHANLRVSLAAARARESVGVRSVKFHFEKDMLCFIFLRAWGQWRCLSVKRFVALAYAVRYDET